MSPFSHTFGDRSPEIGDYIGTESCIDLKDSEGEEKEEVQSPPPPLKDVVETDQGRSRLNRSELMVRRQKREFPPPIPLLARTENLSPHMPWTLRRYYSGDGRLIIREVKVPHHDYFRVNRSGGRLTLDLIPLDNEFLPLGLGIQDQEEQDRNQEDEDQDNQSEGGTEEGNADAVVVKEVADEEESDRIGTSFDNPPEINPPAGGRGVELWNYASSCFFKVNHVPSIRPVQI